MEGKVIIRPYRGGALRKFMVLWLYDYMIVYWVWDWGIYGSRFDDLMSYVFSMEGGALNLNFGVNI